MQITTVLYFLQKQLILTELNVKQQSCEKVFSAQLEALHPEAQKLNMTDALIISCNSIVTPNMVPPDQLFNFTLQKIMTCEYENGLCCFDKNQIDTDVSSTAHSFENDSDSNSDIECAKEDDVSSIHPVDNLLALFHYSDLFLCQALISKLSFCQIATPILLPNPLENSVTLMLWATRSVVKEWTSNTQLEGQKYNECSIINYPAFTVSFLRIGAIKKSKSEIANKVIGDGDYFFYREIKCNGSKIKIKCRKKITNGLVDLCYCLPSTSQTDHSVDPVLFLNLHGDARQSEKQLNFLQNISNVLVVFVNPDVLDDSNTMEIIKNMSSIQKQVILFIKKSQKLPKENICGIETHYFSTSKSVEYFRERIQNKITEQIRNIDSGSIIPLSKSSPIAYKCGIKVDEDDDVCKRGKIEAEEIFAQLQQHSPQQAKMSLFPLQGPRGWQKWAKIDKDQYKEFRNQDRDLERYHAVRNAKKQAIRKQMREYCKNLPQMINLFLKALINYNDHDNARSFFLAWLKLLLDDRSREVLSGLRAEYIRATKTNSEHRAKELALALCDASIGLEHFFREISQVYETLAYVDQLDSPQALEQNVMKLPHIMAKILMSGQNLEMMDGDASHLPVKWISAVFNELQSICKPANLYTISIVGVQSTGKSTLLNIMFGLNFNVSAGRCTRGANMQLLSLDEYTRKRCKFDHLLLIDTEGLRAPELQFISKEHDNQLATLVIGLADTAIINMGGETQSEFSDILQTVTHALIRMDQVELHPGCIFVHQHTSSPGVQIKTESGRQAFLDMLDKNVERACELEMAKNKYQKFSQVIKFDDQLDIKYFSSLWKGNPPMAKVNKQYTDNATSLKELLINKSIVPSTFTTFSEKIQSLWSAVLLEHFLFSFKNTLEVAARKEFDQKHSLWNEKFHQDLLEWEKDAKLESNQDKTEDIKLFLLKKVNDALEGRYNDVLQEREAYFKESEYRQQLVNWNQESIDIIKKAKKIYCKEADILYEQLAVIQKNKIKATEMNKKIHVKIDDLAETLISETETGHLYSDNELMVSFNERWNEWLDEIPSVHYKSNNEIEYTIVNKLRTFFQMDLDLFNTTLAKTPFKQWRGNLMIDSSCHIEIKKSHEKKIKMDQACDFVRSKCFPLLDNLNRCISSADVVNNFQELLLVFHQQINKLIESIKMINDSQGHPLRLKKQFVIDLSLTAAKNSEQLLVGSQIKSRKNDPKLILVEKKSIHFKQFCDRYHEKMTKQLAKVAEIKQQEERAQGLQKDIEKLEKDAIIKKEADEKMDRDRQMKQERNKLKDEKDDKHRQERLKKLKEKDEKKELEFQEKDRKRRETFQKMESDRLEREKKQKEVHYKKQQELQQKEKQSKEEYERIERERQQELQLKEKQSKEEYERIERQRQQEAVRMKAEVERHQQELQQKKKESEDKAKQEKEKIDQEIKQKQREADEQLERIKENNRIKQNRILAEETKRIHHNKKSYLALSNYFCSLLENATHTSLKESMLYAVYEDMKSDNTYLSKNKYKCMVLRKLLDTDDFEEYKEYFSHPLDSFEKWMKYFVTSHCRKVRKEDNGLSRFEYLAKKTIHSLIKKVNSAIDAAHSTTFDSWVNELYLQLKTCQGLAFEEYDIKHLANTKISWMDKSEVTEFKNVLKTQVEHFALHFNTAAIYNAIEAELQLYIWNNFKQHVLGCTACCPFCNEMCDNVVNCTGEHETKFHRPQCFAGYKWVKSNKMNVEICTTCTGNQTYRFKNDDTNDEYIYYVDYKDYYPTWHIPGVGVQSPPLYWQWVVGHYALKLAEWCNADVHTQSVPEEWIKVEIQEAKKSLNTLFK